MLACATCGSDVHGWYVARKLPAVLGHEPVGEVVEVGAGVERVAVGDVVAIHHHAACGRCAVCRAGHETLCPQFRSTALDPGGFAEYVRIAPSSSGSCCRSTSLDPVAATLRRAARLRDPRAGPDRRRRRRRRAARRRRGRERAAPRRRGPGAGGGGAGGGAGRASGSTARWRWGAEPFCGRGRRAPRSSPRRRRRRSRRPPPRSGPAAGSAPTRRRSRARRSPSTAPRSSCAS